MNPTKIAAILALIVAVVAFSKERSADTAPYARKTRRTAPPGTHPALQ